MYIHICMHKNLWFRKFFIGMRNELLSSDDIVLFVADLKLIDCRILWLDKMSDNYDSGAVENGEDVMGSSNGGEPVDVFGMANAGDQVLENSLLLDWKNSIPDLVVFSLVSELSIRFTCIYVTQ